jgi:hypothetical protein
MMASPRTLPSAALSIPVFYLREGQTYIAYTPVLDLSASGSTVTRAKKNFETTLRLFLDELIAHGTLADVLRDMGWSKHDRRWRPPVEMARASSVPFWFPVAA